MSPMDRSKSFSHVINARLPVTNGWETSDGVILAIVAFATIGFYAYKHLTSSASKTPVVEQDDTQPDDSRNVARFAQESKKDCIVLYGSQSGTAEDLAFRLAQEAKTRFSLQAAAVDLGQFDYESLDEYPADKILIFVVATYGEGEPTENAVGFYEHIMQHEPVFSQARDTSLSNLHFAAFGLGNSSYQNYNAVVGNITSSMRRHGAHLLGPMGRGDDGKRTLDEDFIAWKEVLWASLTSHMGIEERIAMREPLFEVREYANRNSVDSMKVHLGELDPEFMGLKDDSATYFLAPMTSSKELSRKATRSYLHLELNIEGPGLTYEAGDHVAVWPMNASEEVNHLLQVLDLYDKRDQVIEIQSLEPTTRVPFPTPTTYEAACRHYLEICGPVSRQLVQSLATFSPNEIANEEMARLGNDKDYFREKTGAAFHTISRLLYSVSKGQTWKIPFGMLVEWLPRLKPRYYSISSSPLENPRSLSMTVVVDEHQTTDNSYVFRGVASNYLQALQIAQNQMGSSLSAHYKISGPRNAYKNFQMPIRIRQSHFRLPSNPSIPVIMIGAGSGVAPFRGFMQERASHVAQGITGIGQTMLFLGCRHPQQDFLYESDWEEYTSLFEGRFQLVTAFSRFGSRKCYVQHRMLEHSPLLNALLQDGGHVYVCGDAAKMAADVHRTLVQIIEKERRTSSDDASQILRDMKTSKKYQEDIW